MAIISLHEKGILRSARSAIKFLYYTINSCCRSRRITQLSRHYNLDKIVDYAYCDCGGLITVFQNKHEILQLLGILHKTKPKYILEIGTAGGGTLFLFSRIASEDAILISIDLPGGRFGGGYPKWKIPVYKSFAILNQRIYLIRGDSNNTATFGKVKSILGSNKIDFLFVDGDHAYSAVKKDFEMYSTLVKDDGLISFHDIAPGPEERTGGVPEFWEEIKYKYDYREIVEDWKQGGFGIGLISTKDYQDHSG